MQVRFLSELLSDGLNAAVQAVERYETAIALIPEAPLHETLVRFAEQSRLHAEALDRLARRAGVEAPVMWPHPLIEAPAAATAWVKWRCLQQLAESETRVGQDLRVLQAVGEAVGDRDILATVQDLEAATGARAAFLTAQLRQGAGQVFAG